MCLAVQEEIWHKVTPCHRKWCCFVSRPVLISTCFCIDKWGPMSALHKMYLFILWTHVHFLCTVLTFFGYNKKNIYSRPILFRCTRAILNSFNYYNYVSFIGCTEKQKWSHNNKTHNNAIGRKSFKRHHEICFGRAWHFCTWWWPPASWLSFGEH